MKFKLTGSQFGLQAFLFLIWVFITLVFGAIPGDLMYFPKLLMVNNHLTPLQKIDILWPSYKIAQEQGNCNQSVLIEQELLREIINQVAIDKRQLLQSFKNWQVPEKVSCNTALPFNTLKVLTRFSDSSKLFRYKLVDISRINRIHIETQRLIAESQHTGFKSQRALNSFTSLALDMQNNQPAFDNYTYLEIYERELKLATMQNILKTGDTLAANYQQLFLASCLLTPEYEVCQSADKFNAKWNSVAASGTPELQLKAGRNLLNEILVYQGLSTNN